MITAPCRDKLLDLLVGAAQEETRPGSRAALGWCAMQAGGLRRADTCGLMQEVETLFHEAGHCLQHMLTGERLLTQQGVRGAVPAQPQNCACAQAQMSRPQRTVCFLCDADMLFGCRSQALILWHVAAEQDEGLVSGIRGIEWDAVSEI